MTTTITDPKLDKIHNLYAAYGRGDVAGALADLADDVDWAAEASGDSVPWFGNYRGKEQVPEFFAAIASSVDVTLFEVVGLASNDTDVIATIRWSYTVKATGKTASMYMQHWWRFADGRIVFFRGSEDSDQSARAFS
jgi:ketosteroid isomerase-like protein